CAGGVNVERTIVDGRGPALALVQRVAAISFDGVVDAWKPIVASVHPDVRRTREVLAHSGQSVDELRGHNQMPGCRRVDAMRERRAGEVRVEQRDDAADAGD